MRPIRAPPQNRGTRIVNRGNVYLLQMYTYIHVGDILGHMRFMLFLFLFSDVRSGEFLPKRQHTLAARGFRSQHTLASTTNLPWPRELTFKGTPTHVGAPPPRVALANVHPHDSLTTHLTLLNLISFQRRKPTSRTVLFVVYD